MTTVSLTIDQLAALEAHTNLTTDFTGEDTRALRANLTEGGGFSYDIDGANGIALGNWSGLEWDELVAWAGQMRTATP